MAELVHGNREIINLIFLHKGSFGDIIYSWPSIEQYRKKFEDTNTGVHVTYLAKDRLRTEQFYRLAAVQPYIDQLTTLPQFRRRGVVTDFNTKGQAAWDIENPDTPIEINRTVTIKECPWLGEIGAQVFDQNILIDLNRHYLVAHFNNLSRHLIDCHAGPLGLSIDMHKPWIYNVTPNLAMRGKIIVNQTTRYNGTKRIDWKNLTHLQDKIIHIGSKIEHKSFCSWGFEVEHLPCWDMFSMAEAIAGCSLFIGNQSCPFSIAEGLKVPRILSSECVRCPNCTPESSNSCVHTNIDDVHALVATYVP
jgi:hypothetical protein